MKNIAYLCNAFRKQRELSSAGSERLPYKQRVGGSNPSAPTENETISKSSRFFVYATLSRAAKFRIIVGRPQVATPEKTRHSHMLIHAVSAGCRPRET